MKTKINIRIIGLAMLVFSSVSCADFVDVVPDNIAVIEDAFKTRDQAENFLASLYGDLPSFASEVNPALLAGDEIAVNDDQAFGRGYYTMQRGGQGYPRPVLAYMGSTDQSKANSVSNLYIPLRNCNIFLENVDLPFDLTLGERIRWTAEAKFLKAYYHFYLMRMYGPIPIVRENIEVSEGVDAVRVSREPVDVVTDYIVQLLDEAIPYLPLTISNPEEMGRATAPAAAAIKARVLMLAASPLFNGNSDYSGFVDAEGRELINTSYDPQKWSKAAAACDSAIMLAHSAGHSLYTFKEGLDTWSDTTILELSIRGSVTDRWNEELIWGASGRTVSGGMQGNCQARIHPDLTSEYIESVGSNWAPTMRIAEMFYSQNGVPIEEDPSYDYTNRFSLRAVTEADNADLYLKTGEETAILHQFREPRFYASLGFDQGKWFGHGIINPEDAYVVNAKNKELAGYFGGVRYSRTGYWPKKLVWYTNFQTVSGGRGYTSRPYPFPVVRLADLYLMYAEALNESGQTGAAYEWIDAVRERAGLDGVVQSWANHSNNPSKPLSAEGLREIIQRERMIELVFEGQRFWDLRRWKLASEYLNTPIRGWNIFGEETEDYYKVVTTGNFQFLNRYYLWPISEHDLITNSNLIQSPGW
ncbi:RagB/SusD family nutrient uptake outer membrane protein [Marinoscillum furvescens]|uniref:Putative outer membrane starch-binding protein n=1 Tax=Marinoscillum furvescens DSM 4134 TaxID=1122208 RepID=A0A3D9L346_MARFU|nr:RagB/SusD family nutrient uptake outer membrane protein [Marinoscillum furvescens]RED98414.1 putative outer membrane starch-binding protein [Marinoscillum furvescens DSM 4134]